MTITQKLVKLKKKITDHDHDKYIPTPEFNKLSAENVAARLAKVNLASKCDIAYFIKKTDFDDERLREQASNKYRELSDKERI